MQRLREDAEAEQADDEQRARPERRRGSARTARQPCRQHERDHAEQQEEPQEQLLRRARATGIGQRSCCEQAGPLQEAVDVRPRRRDREAAPAAQVEHGVEHHARARRCPGPAVATWIDVRRDADSRSPTSNRLTRASGPCPARARSPRGRRRGRGRAGTGPRAPSSRPAASAQRRALRSPVVGRRPRASIPAASPSTPSPTPPTQASAVSPNGMMMSADVTAAATASDPSPPARERVDAEHDRELLAEPEEPLGQERDAEHLEHAGERPQAPRPVEVQEVAVGDRAVQHELREDEHEALFHRRPGRAEQAAQRQREHERDHRERRPRRGGARGASGSDAAAARTVRADHAMTAGAAAAGRSAGSDTSRG